MATKLLSREEAKKALGDMPERTFARWVAKGLPRKGDGKEARYPWPELLLWLFDQHERRGREAVEKDSDSAATRQRDAEARIAEAKAEAIELDLSERRGELDTVTNFRKTLTDAFQRVKAQLLAVPHKHAPEMVGLATPADAAEKLSAAVRSIMDELQQADDVPVPADESEDDRAAG